MSQKILKYIDILIIKISCLYILLTLQSPFPYETKVQMCLVLIILGSGNNREHSLRFIVNKSIVCKWFGICPSA